MYAKAVIDNVMSESKEEWEAFSEDPLNWDTPVTTQLDLVWNDDNPDCSVAKLRKETTQWVKKFGDQIKFKVVDRCGPGGGAPVVEFTGPLYQMRALVTDWCRQYGDDDVDYHLFGE